MIIFLSYISARPDPRPFHPLCSYGLLHPQIYIISVPLSNQLPLRRCYLYSYLVCPYGTTTLSSPPRGNGGDPPQLLQAVFHGFVYGLRSLAVISAHTGLLFLNLIFLWIWVIGSHRTIPCQILRFQVDRQVRGVNRACACFVNSWCRRICFLALGC